VGSNQLNYGPLCGCIKSNNKLHHLINQRLTDPKIRSRKMFKRSS